MASQLGRTGVARHGRHMLVLLKQGLPNIEAMAVRPLLTDTCRNPLLEPRACPKTHKDLNREASDFERDLTQIASLHRGFGSEYGAFAA